MESSDALRFALAFVFMALGFSLVYVSWWIVKVLKSFKKIIDEVEGTTHDVQVFKEGVKIGITKLLGLLAAKKNKRIKQKRN